MGFLEVIIMNKYSEIEKFFGGLHGGRIFGDEAFQLFSESHLNLRLTKRQFSCLVRCYCRRNNVDFVVGAGEGLIGNRVLIINLGGQK